MRSATLTRQTLRAAADVLGAIIVIIAAALAGAALILYGLPRFITWTAADVMLDPPAPLAAPALPVPVAATCRPPTEHEQLLITVIADEGGNVAATCRHIGPRGAYVRSRHGMPEPRP